MFFSIIEMRSNVKSFFSDFFYFIKDNICDRINFNFRIAVGAPGARADIYSFIAVLP